MCIAAKIRTLLPPPHTFIRALTPTHRSIYFLHNFVHHFYSRNSFYGFFIYSCFHLSGRLQEVLLLKCIMSVSYSLSIPFNCVLRVKCVRFEAHVPLSVPELFYLESWL